MEEAIHTDILLHLVDVSSSMAELQAEATIHVLKELNITQQPIITVLNKIDQCKDSGRLHRLRIKYPKTIQISALNKTGFDHLMEVMAKEVSTLRKQFKLRIPQSHYALVSELMREGRVIFCNYEDNDILLHIEISGRFEHKIRQFIHEFA